MMLRQGFEPETSINVSNIARTNCQSYRRTIRTNYEQCIYSKNARGHSCNAFRFWRQYRQCCSNYVYKEVHCVTLTCIVLYLYRTIICIITMITCINITDYMQKSIALPGNQSYVSHRCNSHKYVHAITYMYMQFWECWSAIYRRVIA